MKKRILLSILFYFTTNWVFSQNEKIYTITSINGESSFSNEYLISFDSIKLRINIIGKISNYYYFTLKQNEEKEIFRINKDSVSIQSQSLANRSSTNKNVGNALNKFARQQKMHFF